MISLTDLRNRHQGETAFVLASGPSTRHANVDAMHRHGIVITSNSAIMHDNNPDYHIIMDGAVPYLKSFDLVASSGAIVGGHDSIGMRGMIPTGRRLMFCIERSCRLSRDAGCLTQWTTTPITAVHFAITLGCKRVILLGCDCQREDGKRYFYEFWSPPVDDPMVEDFAKTGFVRPYRRVVGVGDSAKDSKEVEGGWFGAALGDWDAAAKLIPDDVAVFNASGGRVKCFPEINIERVLGRGA